MALKRKLLVYQSVKKCIFDNFVPRRKDELRTRLNSNKKEGSKTFWNAMKPLFTYRGTITNDNIALEENVVLKNDLKETTEFFNNYYINIVETISGKQPSSISNPNSQHEGRDTVKKKSMKLKKAIPVLQP